MAILLSPSPRLAAAVGENRADIIEVISLSTPLLGNGYGMAYGLASPFLFHLVQGKAPRQMGAAKDPGVICRGFASCRLLRSFGSTAVISDAPFALLLAESGHAAARLLAAAFVLVEILQFVPVDEANTAFFIAADEVYLL